MKKHKLHKDITYNPLQQESEKHIDSDCNLVVLAPTSSGKTIVAEQFILKELEAGKKAIYLSPLKALTNEKLLAWSHWPYSHVAITSDHSNKPRSMVEQLILMTTEALDSRSRSMKGWLKKVGVVVVDEAHLLSASRRGDATEVGLTRFSQNNQDARLILLSATIPNAQELGEWLTVLNGKPTEVIETEWRPVVQEHHLVYAADREWYFNDAVVKQAQEIRREHPDKQLLVFVHAIGKGRTLADRLGCPFHYSKVSKEQRYELEEAFKAKKLMTMVSTSTLAYGVNLPADFGVIAGAHRGPVMVDAQDIKQMAGRIGRYGLSEKGTIYYVFKRKYANQMWHEIKNIPSVNSVLHERLYFHITSFVAREYMQREEIDAFVAKTLEAHQGKVDVDEALDVLLQYQILYKEGEELIPSSLARASAMMYVDPIDLYHLRENLSHRPMTPTLIAQAFARLPSYEVPTYVPDDIGEILEMPYGQQTNIATCLRTWLRGKEISGTIATIIMPYISDIERWMSALAIAGGNKEYLKSLTLMIVNGVPELLLDLVGIPRVGRKRAMGLYKLGIKTPDDILNNPRKAANILGKKTFAAVKGHIETPEGKILIAF